jgi:hypothetical protein
MHCRLRLMAGCLACLLVAGCGGRISHVVESTGPDDPTRAVHPPAEEDQGSPGGNAAPEFPPNYRTRVAVMLAVDYLRDGRGAPEISDLMGYSNVFSGRTSLCVRYPAAPGPPSYSGVRSILIWAVRGWGSFGKVEYRSKMLGVLENCRGTLKPYPELEQIAQKLRECQARDERRCVVNVEANRRDLLVLPPPPGTGRNAPATRPD